MALLAGRYRIDSPLGAGCMGEVFLAHDTALERRVAIKLLPAGIEADSVARERLRREALAAASLDHPFICKMYEIVRRCPAVAGGAGRITAAARVQRVPRIHQARGRMLTEDPRPAEQTRGRAMIEAALTDFRALEMVLHANLAEQTLRR